MNKDEAIANESLAQCELSNYSHFDSSLKDSPEEFSEKLNNNTGKMNESCCVNYEEGDYLKNFLLMQEA